MRVELEHVALPDFGLPVDYPAVPVADYEAAVKALLELAGTEWVAVYGDREHFANIFFLTGFDPRFEEALLLLGTNGRRVMLVGSEGLVHAKLGVLPVELVHYQPFSLMGQPLSSPKLDDLLHAAGVGPGQRVGIAGWKYMTAADDDDPDGPSYVPYHIMRAIERVIGSRPVDVTWALMHPQKGIRTRNTAAQIAQLEWGSARASACAMRVIRGAKPGLTEMDAAANMGYAGEMLNMHPVLTSSKGPIDGLKSAIGTRLEEGDGIFFGIGFWGGLCARAGLLVTQPDEAYMAAMVRPYYRAIAAWWSTIGIGVTGAELHRVVVEAIGDAAWKPFLQPGHLTSFDEWLHSMVGPGSTMTVHSGMAWQCDIIPDPTPDGWNINCEDGLAIADEGLRREIQRQFPALWKRIEARRAFMKEKLGITVKPEVLPLSSSPAYLNPAWLSPDLACVIRP